MAPPYERLIELLFGNHRRVTLSSLNEDAHGGLTLQAVSLSRMETIEDPVVVRMHNASSIVREVASMSSATGMTGLDSMRVLRGPCFVNATGDAVPESTIGEARFGAVVYTLLGPCWTLPECWNMTRLCTYKDALSPSLKIDCTHEESEISAGASVLSELWERGGLLYDLAVRSPKCTDVSSTSAGGLVQTALRCICEEMVAIALPPQAFQGFDGECATSVRFVECMTRLIEGGRVSADESDCRREEYAQSVVHSWEPEQWEQLEEFAKFLSYLDTLLTDTETSSWLTSWYPLQIHQHCSLTPSEIVVDERGRAWVIDHSQMLVPSDPFIDTAGLVTALLFEQYPNQVRSLDEVKNATGGMLRSWFGLGELSVSRLIELACKCDEVADLHQLANTLDTELATAIHRISDEATITELHDGIDLVVTTLLDAQDESAPHMLWQLTSRRLASTKAEVHNLYQIIVSTIIHGAELTARCSQICHGGTRDDPFHFADLHVAPFLISMLLNTLRITRGALVSHLSRKMALDGNVLPLDFVWCTQSALSDGLNLPLECLTDAKLSLRVRKSAWNAAAKCARALQVSLQHSPVQPQSHEFAVETRIDPIKLATGQHVWLLLDYCARLSGTEGALVAGIIHSDVESTSLKVQPGSNSPGAIESSYSFDDISQVILPWPIPSGLMVEESPGLESTENLSNKARRLVMVPAFSRYPDGQELIAMVDGAWLDVKVRGSPEHPSSTIHQVQMGASRQALLLNPWNHAPKLVNVAKFNKLKQHYSNWLARRHTHITDAISGQQHGVLDQCVPFDISMQGEAPVTKPPFPSIFDVEHVYKWARSAYSARCECSSALSRVSRLVSHGSPDEAAQLMIKELQQVSRELPAAQQRGAAELQKATDDFTFARTAFLTSLDKLLSQQRIELNECSAEEQQNEDTLKGLHQVAQKTLANDKAKEKSALLDEQQRETRQHESEHQQQRAEISSAHSTSKVARDQEMDRVLRSFKEGQLREGDLFKRQVASQRVEDEKALSAKVKQLQDELKQNYDHRAKELQDAFEKEVSELTSGHEAENAALALKQECAVVEVDADSQTMLTDLETRHRDEIASVGTLQDGRSKEQTEQNEEQRKAFYASQRDEVKALGAQQEEARKMNTEEQNLARKDLLARQKEEVRQHTVHAEQLRTDLTAKHEADRKAALAVRKGIMSKAQGDQLRKEQGGEAGAVVEKEVANPQKERKQLDSSILEERKELTAKHEREAEQLLSDQVEESEQLKMEQEQEKKALQSAQEKARQALVASQGMLHQKLTSDKDGILTRLQLKQEQERAAFEEMCQAKLSETKQRLQEELDSARSRQQQTTKALAAKLSLDKEQASKLYLNRRTEFDRELDQNRRTLAATAEEELSRFASKQEGERSKLVAQHKSEERELDQNQTTERVALEARLVEQREETDARQHVELREMDSLHAARQVELDADQQKERVRLSETLKALRAQRAATQQLQRDQRAEEGRERLSLVTENAQNTFNRARIGNACILLTGGPASGKSCLVSQLVMRIISDDEGTLVPVPIRMQHLHQFLLKERSMIRALTEKHDSERIQLFNSKQQAESAELPDQVPPAAADKRRAWGLVKTRLAYVKPSEANDRLDEKQKELLRHAYEECHFATSWNWVDAYLRYLHGSNSVFYLMLRQALMARRALIILDGLEEAGSMRSEVEHHLVHVLAPQGHTVVATSRPYGLDEELFSEQFARFQLHPLTNTKQQQLIELRIKDKLQAQSLLEYVRSRVPVDNDTSVRMTANPLMLSMIINLFERRDSSDMPATVSALYETASTAMLQCVNRRERVDTAASVAMMPHLESLLEATFLRTHAAERRLIKEDCIMEAALQLGAPELLATLQWPAFRGRLRVGHTVRLLRGPRCGDVGILSKDTRSNLVNGKAPSSPFKVKFTDSTTSSWLKESDLSSSGLDQVAFDARFGGEGKSRALKRAIEKLPVNLKAAVEALKSRVMQDQLLLLRLLHSEPLQMEASHLSFQEYYAARAIYSGQPLPGQPPWRWSVWWANALRLGKEFGPGFGRGLVASCHPAVLSDKLDLVGQLGGHRQTSLAAVAEMMLSGVSSIDLSSNKITPSELQIIVSAVSSSSTLSVLTLSNNPLRDEGISMLAAALPESRLSALNLFCTGIKEHGAAALTAAIAHAGSLTRLNLQYNALRADSKKALESANAARSMPLFLIT